MGWPEWLDRVQYRGRLLAAKGTGARRIAAGTSSYDAPFVVVVDDDGVVGSKGCGAYGMLGHADAEDRLQLTVIEALRGRPVVQVSAGAGHGMVLLANGTLVTYGEGHQGCLGHGDIQAR